MSQPSKTAVKMKKNSKDREKRRSFLANSNNNCSNPSEKSSVIEPSTRRYASLCIENIKTAAEHTTIPELISDEAYELLAEDLNYKLRYIIHQASNRSFISNRTVITCKDIEETFNDLCVDKVYGAASNPTWIPLNDQSYLYLDDPLIDIQDEIEEEISYFQPADPIIQKSWLPESTESNKAFKNYFRTICEAVVSNDVETRKMALQNISSNPNIGPIIEWFYQFGYILLSKDITFNSLTLYALDLIETLEMSPLGNAGANEDQLKLLVRLVLQRLLKSFTSIEILRPMCWVLSILSRRFPLREFVMMKLMQKLPELSVEFSLPLLMIVNALGLDAIMAIFVRNMGFFVDNFLEHSRSLYGYTVMETFNILYKNDKHEVGFSEKFPELEDFMVMLYRPKKMHSAAKDDEVAFGNSRRLVPARRKLDTTTTSRKLPITDVFDVSRRKSDEKSSKTYANFKIFWSKSYSLKDRLETHERNRLGVGFKEQTYVEVGKTTVLLTIFKRKQFVSSKCYDHSLFSYNF